MNSLTNPLDVLVVGVKEQIQHSLSLLKDTGISAQKIDCNFTNDFSDGKLDGENNFEPIAYQWLNSNYRKGYLIGMAKRIGIEYTLIHSVKTSKVIVID
jgi:hypothetical protein